LNIDVNVPTKKKKGNKLGKQFFVWWHHESNQEKSRILILLSTGTDPDSNQNVTDLEPGKSFTKL
jgi:hypothetical protein